MSDEEIMNLLNSELNEQEKDRTFKKMLIGFCNKESVLLNLFRILKGVEIELKNCLSGKIAVSASKSVIEKWLCVIRVELQIVRLKIKNPTLVRTANEKFPIKWTDNKVDLVELIYAISLVSSVDRGKASIKTIKEAFEFVFGVNLGNIHDRINEIMYRKGSRAQYLEKLINSLNNFLDKSNN